MTRGECRRVTATLVDRERGALTHLTPGQPIPTRHRRTDITSSVATSGDHGQTYSIDGARLLSTGGTNAVIVASRDATSTPRVMMRPATVGAVTPARSNGASR